MYVLRAECSDAEKDRLIAEFWEHGTAGVVEEEEPGSGRWRLAAFFSERVDLPGTWEPAEERDWVAVAQGLWEPLEVGERFFLVPPWRDDTAPPGRIRLEMRPGRACGTGWHPATRLALRGLEAAVRPGDAVLDVGTGSGILSVAAAQLGARRIYACDIDFEAVALAHEAGVPAALFAGSVRSVRPESMDVVVANINAASVADLAPEMLRVARRCVVVSGFERRQIERVRAAYSGRAGELLEEGGWAAVVYCVHE